MDRSSLSPAERALFDGVPRLRAVIDSVLEGHLGAARVDDPSHPRLARLELGCYTIFGGDPSAPATRSWVASVAAPRELLFPEADAWRRVIRDVHGERVSDRSMQAFSAEHLDRAQLRELARPTGGIELRRIDADLASRLDDTVVPHAMQVFESAADFAARGIGFAAVVGERPVCTATSYAFSHGTIELAIATHPDFRGRGLAGCVAATLIGHCLDRGVTPQWNAANPVSRRLAVRLGYRPDGICEVLMLRPAGSALIR